MAQADIRNTVAVFLDRHPTASNDEVASHVRKIHKGARTTAASVSSIKSRLKAEGNGTAPLEWVGDDAAQDDPLETVEEAAKRISVRYNALERMSARIVEGQIPSLIVSGPPGIGKSYTVRKAVRRMSGDRKSVFVSGAASPVGLYKTLFQCAEGGVVVLDDCDDVFHDDTSLNLLKAALDSDEDYRTISWLKEAAWMEREGVPDSFEFKGSVVFLTNIDFEAAIESGRPGAEHFKALIDRSMYLCLTLRTRRDFMIRIRQVALGPEGILRRRGGSFEFTEKQESEVLGFIDENKERFYNLSLRLVNQVATCMKADPEGWREDVEATKMKTLS